MIELCIPTNYYSRLNHYQMGTGKGNIIVTKSFEFALELVAFTEYLRKHKKYEMGSQLFKSGTSIGANIAEAQNAESKTDFIHKFKLAAKEAEETHYWLRLCRASEFYPDPPVLLDREIREIILILSKIIGSSKRGFRME